MSVINQMLQDLEQRRSRAGTTQGALSDLIWPGVADSDAQWRIKALVWALTVLIAVLVGVLLWDYLGVKTPAAVPVQTAVQLPPAAVPAPPPVLPPVAPAALPGAMPNNAVATAPLVAPPVQNQSADAAAASVNEPGRVALGEPVPEFKITEPEEKAATAQRIQPGVAEQPVGEPDSRAGSSMDSASIRAVRLSATPGATRLVFDVSATMRYRVSTVDPKQLVVEMDDTRLTEPLASPDLRGSLLSAFRAEPHADKVRIVLDLKQPVRVKSYSLPPKQNYGQRLVLDLHAEDGLADAPAAFSERITQPKDMPAANEAVTTAPAAARPIPADNTTGKTLRTQTPEQQADLAYQEGARLLQGGQFSAAEEQLRKALQQNPQHTRARESLAVLMINNKRLSEAEDLLAEGITLSPQYMPLTKLYARVLMAQDRTEAAVQALEKITPEAAQDPNYYAFIAALHQRLERHSQAISAYRTALKIQPQQGLWWMGLGISLEATGEQRDALDAYRHALAGQSLHGAPLDYVQERLAALKLQDG